MLTDHQKRILENNRDTLVHVIPDLCVNGVYGLALEISYALRQHCSHLLLYEGDPYALDPMVYWHAQGSGMVIANVEEITPESLDDPGFTAAILYNVVGKPDLGAVRPSLYYSYGFNDADVKTDLRVACSKLACSVDRWANVYNEPMDEALVVAPFIQSRVFRRIKADPAKRFIVAMITSGYAGKYPGEFLVEFLGKCPDDIVLLYTAQEKYEHPGVELALKAFKERGGMAMPAALKPAAGAQYIMRSDLLLYATAPGYVEPYGRTVMEAMALGKPVVCENHGVFKTTLDHGVNAMLFDTVDEAVGHIEFIRNNEQARDKLIANAQMYASWQDVTAHLGKLKRLLRMIGV